jgi:uncharacterized protein with PIN domain
MRFRLYLDEDSMREDLVRALRARGVDVVTALDAAMIERSDSDHLEFASSQGRVVVTCSVADFWRLHGDYLAAERRHAGIILVQQQRYSIGAQMRGVLGLIAAKSAAEMIGEAEFLSAWE